MMRCNIFITSHNSPNECKTLDTLLKFNYKGNYFIVVDDKDTYIDIYKEKYKEHLLIFNKDYYIDKTDSGVFPKDECSAVYVKNYIEDYAQSNNFESFIIMDDDLLNLKIRCPGDDNKLHTYKIYDVNDVFDYYIQYMLESNIDGLTFGIQPIYMGGVNLYKPNEKRYITNIYFRTTKHKVNWNMLIYDDFNTSISIVKYGYVFLMLPFIQMEFEPQFFQIQNENSNEFRDGGLVEIYKKYDSFKKSFFSVMIQPSSIKPYLYKNVFWWRTSNDNTFPKIISSRFKENN